MANVQDHFGTFKRRAMDLAEQQQDLEYHLRMLSSSFLIRMAYNLFALAVYFTLHHMFSVSIPYEVPLLFSFWLLTSVLYFVVFRTGICRTVETCDNIHFSYYFIGLVCATALIHYLGGAEWMAFLVFALDLIYANVLLRRMRGIFITVLMATGYVLLLFLEFKGILPHVVIFDPAAMTHDNPRFLMSTHMVFIGFTFLVVSYSTGLFSQMYENREKILIESKNRFAAKSRQLEKLATTLNDKNEENNYLKKATQEYIKKKEIELEHAREDLEDQIEKLRKTQRSMFLMIEDLNTMSLELKESKENLEEKVKERTGELLDISRKLHRSERLAFLGKLAGSVTHELRNPMAVIKNAMYYINKRLNVRDDEKLKKYLDIMEKEINEIDSIIDDIMGFAKTKAPEMERADVNELIEKTILSIDLPKLVKVRKDCKGAPEIFVDISQVMHALINIANNAVMAMQGNGTLTFRAYEKGDLVYIEVKDSGPGIPKDKWDLIFEPLYSSKPKGTGLGLPLAKMMIENQNGKIELESSIGKGATFRIVLPTKQEI
ncbi:MAG: ATP-binding protein [Candidatus Omnitrophica bacterium]|nr:ATP-binding protein [Candidatus Omnitrophota bacterium]MDD5488254.1 ATP-binding protein [Candidatus Omnitrophota bacterium]